MTSLWTDKQWWLDSLWRSLRTFCQTLAGLLVAFFMPRLAKLQSGQAIELGDLGGWNLWLTFILAAAVAALISLLQSIDRGREAVKVASATTAPPVVVAPVTVGDAEPVPTISAEAYPLPTVIGDAESGTTVVTPFVGVVKPFAGCGPDLR